MGLPDFLIRRESEYDHVKGNLADDLDMIISPVDGKLVAVAQHGGVHVCWTCFEQFIDDPTHPMRPVEFNPGGHGTRILLHSGCVRSTRKKVEGGGENVIWDVIKAHQAARFMTKAVKPFAEAGRTVADIIFKKG